jgi:hypothetical protein
MIPKKRRIRPSLVTIFAALIFSVFAVGNGAAIFAADLHAKAVAAGSTWEVAGTTTLDRLTLAQGATVRAPEGHSLTATVNGIEKDLLPGSYQGKIVLTVTDNNVVTFNLGTAIHLVHNFRQGLYIDKSGIVENKSVKAAILGGTVSATGASKIKINSQGDNFNGIYVADGGSYTLKDAQIDFHGNGSNDFAGYGAAVMATGKGSTLVLDRVTINTRGVVRTAAIVGDGGSLIVKNSTIHGYDGVLPSDYRPNLTPGYMWNGPWMLGIAGNLRATSVIGDSPTATYINSVVTAQGWGVLSTDSCRNARLYAIDSKISITGDNGYGTYSDGGSTTNYFYGTEFNVADDGAITTGGTVNYGASTPAKMAELNASLHLGLTDEELKAIPQKQSVVNSGRFGIMFHVAKGTVNIADATTFNTKDAVFLVRGSAAAINVDGSGGAQLKSAKGVILQVMDRDKATPRKDAATGINVTDTTYSEPFASYADVTRDKSHDPTASDDTNIVANYRNIHLAGNFYNGITGIQGDANSPSKNLVLNLSNSTVDGVISSTFAKHTKSTFGSADFRLVGVVSNTPTPAINNGVIVSLDSTSKWVVEGTSYLTKLVLADGASVAAAAGKTVTMTIDGVAKPIAAGTYTGAIVLDLR